MTDPTPMTGAQLAADIVTALEAHDVDGAVWALDRLAVIDPRLAVRIFAAMVVAVAGHDVQPPKDQAQC